MIRPMAGQIALVGVPIDAIAALATAALSGGR
jgi:hypothetical protein